MGIVQAADGCVALRTWPRPSTTSNCEYVGSCDGEDLPTVGRKSCAVTAAFDLGSALVWEIAWEALPAASRAVASVGGEDWVRSTSSVMF